MVADAATGVAGEAVATAPAPPERLHEMDHLRALAMLAGVVFHAALAYSPLMHDVWPTADRQSSVRVDAIVWGLHLVRMPLFFLVSGFFAAWIIARRGGAALARQRVRRILVPFLVAWPLVWWSLSASTQWAAMNVQHPSPMLAFIREWLQQPNAPAMPPGTAHLWFLYYLLLFGVLHWTVRTLELDRIGAWLVARHPVWLLIGLPAFVLPALASVSAPHPAPESLLPQFWAIAFYGAFFAWGTLIHARPDWLQRARPLVPSLALASAVLYTAFLWRIALPGQGQPVASLDVAALEACLSVWLTLLCLIAGQRWLRWPNAVLRYFAQASYWIYLVHLPVIFVLQYQLMDLEWVWSIKLVAALGGTIALCLLSYQALVRRTQLRRFVG